MEFTGALEAARARCSSASQFSTSQRPVSARYPSGRCSRAVPWRNGGAVCKSGAVCGRVFVWSDGGALCRSDPVLRTFSVRQTPSALLRRGWDFRAVARASADGDVGAVVEDDRVVAEEEVVEVMEVAEEVELVEAEVVKSEAAGEEGDVDEYDDEDLGIDKDGNLTPALPEEFLELMKDEGTPPNYWILGFGLLAMFLARRAIWAELQRWGKLLAVLGLAAVDVVVLAFAKLITLGGEPLASFVVVVAWVGLTISKFFRFIAAIIPPGPFLFSVVLSSVVLLVGESVSDTYSSSEKQFPSRNLLDVAGLLGLGGFVGLIPAEVMLLGLAAITVFLILVRKVNPVAGFTPVAAVSAAVSAPVFRYPILVSFIGSSLYRYWKLGYMSQGAVPKERTAKYPRVLTAMLYLIGISLAARCFFSFFDFVRAAISVAQA